MAFENSLPPYNASDPHATFMNSSCFEFLQIELVPMTYRLSNEASTKTNFGEKGLEEDEQREAASRRLEMLGYRVGQGLVERFSRDRPRFVDTLDVIKFLCKDLWTLAFRKQIDNLKTNHRGVYVLTDTMFRPFVRMSCSSTTEATAKAQPVEPPKSMRDADADLPKFLWFPCGIIRGALSSLGIAATVQADTTELPTAVFQIKTASSRP